MRNRCARCHCARRAAGAALTVFVLSALSPGTVQADENEALRSQFRSAYFAAATGADLTDANDGAELRAYPLYRWLEAARIIKSLNLASESDGVAYERAASEFIRRYAGEPVADSVARAWLDRLARHSRYDELVSHYREELATTRLECQWLTARIEIDAIDGLAARVLERWRSPAQLPIECEPAFQWLRDRGLLNEAAIEDRLRLLLENGQADFARIIARSLPAERAAAWTAWADVISSPESGIDALIERPGLPIEFQALVDGFQRLATATPDSAIARIEPVADARELGRDEVSQLLRTVAWGLAWDRDPRALDYFGQLDRAHIDDYTLEWQIRSALWAGDWSLVSTSIDELSAELRSTPAWRYWRARAAAELDDRSRAHDLYESIVATDNFYSALAAVRLGRDVAPNPARLPVDNDLLASMKELAPMIRARELREVDLPVEALAEWRHALASLGPEAQRQSIHIAAEWGWYDVAIATATSEAVFFDYELLYPRPYRSSVSTAARLARLDMPLIYGIMRQESLFRHDAASSAGALGLMQLLRETARRTARNWGRAEPHRDQLFDPETSVVLGAAHLRDLVEQFDGQLAVALAAYNAGPAVAERWLPDDPVPTDIWIENIPYNETRAYIRRVFWHSLVFKWLADRERQDASSWLGTISR